MKVDGRPLRVTIGYRLIVCMILFEAIFVPDSAFWNTFSSFPGNLVDSHLSQVVGRFEVRKGFSFSASSRPFSEFNDNLRQQAARDPAHRIIYGRSGARLRRGARFTSLHRFSTGRIVR